MTKRRDKFQEERTPQAIQPLNDNQASYIQALYADQQIIVMGPAGTGKTFIAGTHAADGLRLRRFGKVIITRPNVPAGRSLGFMPGDMLEKYGPWVAELFKVMSDRMGKGAFDIALKNGDIEIVPFEVMRGRSWDNAFIILDEAQNTTVDEMKMFLTRIGEDSQVVVNGDITQDDLKRFNQASGLSKIIHMIKSRALPIPIIEFTLDDIVRSGICAMWARAFAEEHI